MPLLGIGKKKEAEPAQSEEVPDELPDLPEGEPDGGDDSSGSEDGGGKDSSDGYVPVAGAVPDELPDAGELAPDELPPVSPGEIESSSQPDVLDRRLYFSNLLQKLQEEGISSTKLVSPSANLVADMKKNWKVRKKEAKLDAMQKKVEDTLLPLQKLEKEWTQLHDEIEDKKKSLKQKEKEIQDMAEELKKLAIKTNKAGKK